MDPSFDPDEFLAGARVAYQRVVESAAGKEGLRNHAALGAICSEAVQAGLTRNADSGVWGGWEEFEVGSHLEVSNLSYCFSSSPDTENTKTTVAQNTHCHCLRYWWRPLTLGGATKY